MSDTPTDNEDRAVPRWVTEMHAYYQLNGFYRAEDVLRVLGDQTKGVAAPASTINTKHGRFSFG